MHPTAPRNHDVWLVVPVYNEETVIQTVVKDALTVFPNVICVDDGSADGSAAAITASAAHLVRHPINLGQGAALQTGIAYARARAGARFFVTFDADGQHRVEDAEAMVELARAGDADVVLGSRFLTEDTSAVPWIKRVVLKVVAVLSPAARRLQLTDAHNGLRVLTRPVADDMRITMNGMAHASQIVGYLARSRWRVAEHPVSIRYTEYSQSKGQSLVNGVNILFDLGIRQRGA